MTPGCSVCGYAVEWLRSCYESTWRLFNNSNTETPGFYYFAPPGTPFYPDLHNLWSRVWVTDEGPLVGLGETSAPHLYRRGRLAVPFPPATLVGTNTCIRDGDSIPLPVISRTLAGGVDSRCYAPGPAPTGACTLCFPAGVWNDYTLTVSGASGIWAESNGTWNLTFRLPPPVPDPGLPACYWLATKQFGRPSTFPVQWAILPTSNPCLFLVTYYLGGSSFPESWSLAAWDFLSPFIAGITLPKPDPGDANVVSLSPAAPR